MTDPSPLPECLADLGIGDDAIADTLEPFVLERYARGDLRFRTRAAALARRWRWRHLARRAIGWRFRKRRTRAYVRASYNATWSRRDWLRGEAPARAGQVSLAEWRDEGLVVRKGGPMARVHLLAMERVLAALGPESVLEVGAGNGTTLFVLASLLPGVEWRGIELTEEGVRAAEAVKAEARIPEWLVSYCPKPVVDDGAYRRICFEQGDAGRLPFPDDSFDVVITRQALEQMNKIRVAALSEIARVARRHVVMGEAFADFNRDGLRFDYVKAKEYFDLPIAELSRFGLEPVAVYDDLPRLLRMAVGIVVARVKEAPLQAQRLDS